MDFFSKLELASNRLTKTEKKIATYITEHPEEVLYQSITDLAAKIGVSETSTFRLCKTLGFEGYQGLKMNLAQSLSIANNTNLHDVNQKIASDDDVDTQIQKLRSSCIASLNQTVNLLDNDTVIKAVDLLTNARSIGFFGVGSSNISAQEARRLFSRIRNNVLHTSDLHDQIIVASSMGQQDLAMMISYSGSTKDPLEIMKILKERDVPVLLITRYDVSHATRYADLVLLCGANSAFTGDSLSNRLSQMFIINVLYTYFYMKNYNKAKQMKARSLDALGNRIFESKSVL